VLLGTEEAFGVIVVVALEELLRGIVSYVFLSVDRG
jgi:hypothetical protein